MEAEVESVGKIADLTPLFVEQLVAVDPALHRAVIESIRESLDRPATRSIDKSLNESDTYYVVHTSDLQLLKAAVGVAVGVVPTLNLLGALPTLVGLLYRYRRHRARIDGEQATVLLCLRAARPKGCTLAELTCALPMKEPLSEARVLEVLGSLKSMLLENGKRTDFVAESAGIWSACDV